MYSGFRKFKPQGDSPVHLSINGFRTLCGKTVRGWEEILDGVPKEWESGDKAFCKNCEKSIISKGRS